MQGHLSGERAVGILVAIKSASEGRAAAEAAAALGAPVTSFVAEGGSGRGTPGVEACRVAQDVGAELIVVARDEEDALLDPFHATVIRIAEAPVLAVPRGWQARGEMLVALDGSRRGTLVLDAARALARRTGAAVRVLTVEPAPEKRGLAPPSARAQRLRELVGAAIPITARSGEIAEEILEEARTSHAGTIAVGHLRGSRGGRLARALLAAATQVAVLLVPL